MEYRFQTLDYIVVFVILIVSAGYGLYTSNVKYKQTTLIEYFLAGKNVPMIWILLSYFSTYCAGGMTGMAIEVYLFGSQYMTITLIVPIIVLFVHYLVVPVFYPIQNMSMLKYFNLRFGKAVTIIAFVATLTQMILLGSLNIFISANIIQQVSAISFWMAASIITAICILYSTLGGMRGIIMTDALQAILMSSAILLLLVIGVVKCGGLKPVWDINYHYDRLEFFNFELNPTVRYSFWSTTIGYVFAVVSFNAMNQTLLQRCIMAPSIKSAQKITGIGITMGSIYMLLYQLLGTVMFSYYSGCNLQQTGKIKSINQLNSYFAMEILHEYPTLPGFYFVGFLSGTLSTISSILNSAAALIIAQLKKVSNESQSGTFLCKIIAVLSGSIMFSLLFLMEKFQNFGHASITVVSLICGPTFAVYCIAILFPRGNSKCVAISYLVALAFGIYILAGSVIVKSKDLPKPFANCAFNVTAFKTIDVNTTIEISEGNNLEAYFPLNKVSYMYISMEVFLATIVCFIFFSIISGLKNRDGLTNVIEFDLGLIPPCVQKFQLKLSNTWRKVLLCDVYDDINQSNATTEQINMLSNNAET